MLRPHVALALGRERVVGEIPLAARLTHRHILPPYDSGEAEGFLFVVMPGARVQTLRNRLLQERTLPVAGAVRLARDTADALDHAPLDVHRTFHVADVYAMAGDAGRALGLLDRAVDGGMHPSRFDAEFCPLLASLRGHAEFEHVVARAAHRAAAFGSAIAGLLSTPPPDATLAT